MASRWPYALLAVVAIACDQPVWVKGIVRDPAGMPIDAVTVTFGSSGIPSVSRKTDANGEFEIGTMNANVNAAWVSFEKEGFRKTRRSLDGQAEREMNVTLMPAAR